MVEIINKTDACLACGIVELTGVIHVIAASKQQASLDRNRNESFIIKLFICTKLSNSENTFIFMLP